jgi:hypothetical protein
LPFGQTSEVFTAGSAGTAASASDGGDGAGADDYFNVIMPSAVLGNIGGGFNGITATATVGGGIGNVNNPGKAGRAGLIVIVEELK